MSDVSCAAAYTRRDLYQRMGDVIRRLLADMRLLCTDIPAPLERISDEHCHVY